MISKNLTAAMLSAAVILAGVVSPTAAQAETLTESPTPTMAATATAVPTASATAVPATAPTQSAAPSVAPTAPTTNPAKSQLKSTQSATNALKQTSARGDLTGKTMKFDKSTWGELKGSFSLSPWGNPRKFRVEIYSSKTKKWSRYTSGSSDSEGKWKAYIEATKDNSQTMRLSVDADDTYAAYTGPATTIQRGKSSLTIAVGANPSTIHSVPWEQQSLKFSITDSSTALTFELQKKSGSRWGKVSALKSKRGTASYSFNLPKGSKSSKDGTAEYRVVLNGNSEFNTARSASRLVRWENPNRYTGTAKRAYDYAKGYCPSVLVRLDGNLAKSGRWGEYIIGSKPATMKVYSGTPAQHLRTVALHECAHNLQEKSASKGGKGGWTRYEAKANQLFGTRGSNGIELAAECMAYNMGPKSYWAYGANSSMCSNSAIKSFALASIRGQRVA